MAQSMALASLTATYTDSEGEDELDDEKEEKQGSVTLNTPSESPTDTKPTSLSRSSSPIPVKVTAKVAKLVSYHDDTIVSDEESEATEKHEILIISENEKLESVEIDQIEDDGVQLPPGH